LNESGGGVSNAEVSSALEWLSRIYVIAAGLGLAFLASLEFAIAPGRLTPLPEALPGLLLSLAFSSALWLSGFGACRGVLRWVIALVLAWFLGRAVIGGTLFGVFAFIAPAALAILLVLGRPPRALLALERFASSRLTSHGIHPGSW